MNADKHTENLIARCLEGLASPVELKELEALLLADPAIRREYIENVLLSEDLIMLGGTGLPRKSGGLLPVDILLQRQSSRTIRIAMLAAAAVVLFSAVLFWLQMAPKKERIMADFRAAENSTFAVIHKKSKPRSDGDMLAEGSRLVVEHGAVELTLPHDVRALLEGPASVTLLGERTLRMDQGRAFFEITSPRGKGFTVVTPHQRIVDLGTAFGIDLQAARDGVELHVFTGSVRVDSHDGERGEILSAPRAVELAGARVAEERDASRASFRRELPSGIETLLHEDFESGLPGGADFDVMVDPGVVRDLAGNPFGGIEEDNPWSFQTRRWLTEPAAFHDFGGQPSPGNITTGGLSAKLKDFADGSDTGITLRIAGAVLIESGTPDPCDPPAEGSPAAVLFQATGLDFSEGYLTERDPKESGPTELIFTGMNPGMRYDIALYGDRSGLHSDGKERFTLNSAEEATNRSSTGIVSPFVTMMETRRNASAGHVVRWSAIDPGADGTVSIKIDPSISGAANRSYLSALRITPSTVDGVLVAFNSLPFDPSSHVDGDGMPDRFELANTNPPSATVLDAEGDPDGDGWNNLEEFQHGTDPYHPDTREDGPAASLSVPDKQAPRIVFRQPAHGSSDALPGESLTLAFDEPIRLGTGRILLRNLTDFSLSDLAADGPRTSVRGRILTITPPALLADGEMQPGRICGWECHHGPGIFNPSGEGLWYRHEGLRDKSRNRGVIDGMKGPNLATFGECPPGSRIRRRIGAIAPASRYTVSVAIGVRLERPAADEVFDGYTIRLISGENLLAELSENEAPGPPNSFTKVGFSWDSTSLPPGVAAGDALAIEIMPNQASDASQATGYLDIDNVLVTVTGNGEEESLPASH